MRILEITEFSAGICGVWTRVLSESMEFVRRGHDVTVFSSDIEKGTDKRVCGHETISNVKIRRFKSTGVFWGMPSFAAKIFSKNPTYFDFKEELIRLKPDIVITHLLHHHSLKAIMLCKQLNIPCMLVTHAPFNVKRRFPLNLATWFFDNVSAVSPLISGNRALRQFDRVIAITKWETPYLLDRGVKKEKIAYIPNGLPEEFFKQKKSNEKNDVLFLGRIAPIKDIETLIKAVKELPEISFSIVGSAEKQYLERLNCIIKAGSLPNVRIYPPIYDLKRKIRLIDEHNVFVLPSKREAMPQALLEAMARGKICISSKTDGAKELIENGKNGFLFNIGDSSALADLIRKNLQGNRRIESNAVKTAKKYRWKALIKSYIELFEK